jgi:hypothetical protein
MIEAVTELLNVLHELGIRYCAGGSVASSIHGIARFTQDVDIVAELNAGIAEHFAKSLSHAFYADEGQMREALRLGRSFNLIHFASGFKIDVFPLRRDAFHQGEMARAEPRNWNAEPGGSVTLMVASAEDTILEKLIWYRNGGGVSDRQWGDLLGIVTTRPVDWEYLRQWAPQLGVAELLDRLGAESTR